MRPLLALLVALVALAALAYRAEELWRPPPDRMWGVGDSPTANGLWLDRLEPWRPGDCVSTATGRVMSPEACHPTVADELERLRETILSITGHLHARGWNRPLSCYLKGEPIDCPIDCPPDREADQAMRPGGCQAP